MKKILILTISFLFIGSVAFAQIGFGQNNNQWQNQNKSQLRYNPYNRTWGYHQPNEQLKYNPYNRSWNYQKPGSSLKYNPYNKSWDYAE